MKTKKFEIIFIKEEPKEFKDFRNSEFFSEKIKANNSEEAEGIIINKYNISEDFIRSIYEI